MVRYGVDASVSSASIVIEKILCGTGAITRYKVTLAELAGVRLAGLASEGPQTQANPSADAVRTINGAEEWVPPFNRFTPQKLVSAGAVMGHFRRVGRVE
jgi:hypothetical protein